MRKLRLFSFVLSIIVFIFSSNSISFAADVPDEQWSAPLPKDVLTTPYIGYIADGIGAAPSSGDSWLLGQEADGSFPGKSNVTANHWCVSLTDPACAKSAAFKYSATLGMCSASLTMDCVLSLEAFDANGKKLTVNSVKSYSGTAYKPFTGDPTKGIPSGGAAQIVDIPGAPHSGGTQYLIDVHENGAWTFGKSKSATGDVNAQIYGIKIGPAPANADKAFQTTTVSPGQKLGDNPVGGALPAGSGCILYSASEKTCAYGQSMPLDVNFKLTAKTSVYIMGWFHGRVAHADTTFALDSNKYATIAFSGNPVIVPTYSAWTPQSAVPTAIQAFNDKYPSRVSGNVYGSKTMSSKAPPPTDATKLGGITLSDAMSIQEVAKDYDQASIDQLNNWMASFGEKAAANPTRWIFQSIDAKSQTTGQTQSPESAKQPQGGGDQGAQGQQGGGQQQGAQGQKPAQGGGQQQGGAAPQEDKSTACYLKNAGQFSGLVSTNATQYISGAPTFDAVNGTLDYKVAAPHLLSDGTTFQGSYNLQISDTLARCIYGFSNAPISATISVIGLDGENKVATTIVSDSGGFLRLSANGFTFSSPNIKVKLTQSASAKAVTSGSKAVTIINCLKGKASKKVSGAKPVCPPGYKRA